MTATRWACPRCPFTYTAPIPATEVAHSCPADVGRRVYLRPVGEAPVAAPIEAGEYRTVNGSTFRVRPEIPTTSKFRVCECVACGAQVNGAGLALFAHGQRCPARSAVPA